MISDALVEKWVRLYTKQRMSCEQIAAAMYHDYNKSTIYKYIKRAGVDTSRNRVRFNISMFVHDYNAGMSCERLALIYGFKSVHSVRVRVIRLRKQGYKLVQRPKGFQIGNKMYQRRKGDGHDKGTDRATAEEWVG